MLEILSNDPKTKPMHMAAVLETREPRVAGLTDALCTGTWSTSADLAPGVQPAPRR
jgi:hypothetical protein